MRATISVVIITRNEAANIRACLDSVKWADEIIIADNLSSDATIAIAREYTDKVFIKKMEGFGEQKQFAIDKATGDWILSLDADERVTPQLADDIRKILVSDSSCAGYKIWRKAFYMNVWIRHCGWYNPVTRLFKRGKGRTDMKYVHEDILIDGQIGEIRSPILHYSYTSIEQHVEKMSLYTDYEARMLYEKGLRIGGADAVWLCGVKPVLAFIRKYFFMGGFLDGIPGLVISAFTGYIVFLNHVKVWEMQVASKRKAPEGAEASHGE